MIKLHLTASRFSLSVLALLLATTDFNLALAQSKTVMHKTSALQVNDQKANAQKTKAKTETCDGALDIVPSKALSFTRKRRPSKELEAPSSNQTPKSPNGKTSGGAQ